MEQPNDKYTHFVDHPRYGRRPNYTGLNPDPLNSNVSLHWRSYCPKEWAAKFQITDFPTLGIKRIPKTAILADLSRQSSSAIIPVTHYFDIERICLDCGKPFIFFAEEQKHWYEELGFPFDSDCVRCVPCRKRQQGIARKKKRYEVLFHVQNKTVDQMVEMADCCLSLIESETFDQHATQRVRMLLNRIPSDMDEAISSRCQEFVARLRAIETHHEE